MGTPQHLCRDMHQNVLLSSISSILFTADVGITFTFFSTSYKGDSELLNMLQAFPQIMFMLPVKYGTDLLFHSQYQTTHSQATACCPSIT